MKTIKYLSVLVLFFSLSCSGDSDFDLVEIPDQPIDEPIEEPIDEPIDDETQFTWYDIDNSIEYLTFSTVCPDCTVTTEPNPDAADAEATNVTKWTIPSTSEGGNKILDFKFNEGKGIALANYTKLIVTVRMYWPSYSDIINYDTTGRVRFLLSDGTTTAFIAGQFLESNEAGWHTVEFDFTGEVSGTPLTSDAISGDIRIIGNKFVNIDNGLDFYIDTITSNLEIEDITTTVDPPAELNTWFDVDNSIENITVSTICTDCSVATVANPDATDSEATNVTKWTIGSTSGSGNKALSFDFNEGKGIAFADYANLKVTVRMYWPSYSDISNYDSNERFRLYLSDGTKSEFAAINFVDSDEAGWHTVEFDFSSLTSTLEGDVVSGEFRLIGNRFTNLDNGLEFYIDTISSNL